MGRTLSEEVVAAVLEAGEAVVCDNGAGPLYTLVDIKASSSSCIVRLFVGYVGLCRNHRQGSRSRFPNLFESIPRRG
jgi:hypothetical protein